MSEEHSTRTNYIGGSSWEPLRGYSRAVKVGDRLYVSGTTAINDRGEVFAPGEPYKQTRFVIDRVLTVLRTAGFHVTDVVRTRLYITQANRWDEYARAHRETFEHVRPASSMVQVARLVDPRLVIELEAEAIAGHERISTVAIQFTPDE